MMPTSLPKNAPLPADPFYFVSPALEQFERYRNRVAYTKAFGVDAPPHDPARHIKDWFDSSDFTGMAVVTYIYYDPASTGFKTMAMLPAEAASVNLPGASRYPAYVNPDTPATFTDAITHITKPLEKWNLISLEDAQELSIEIGGDDPTEGMYNTSSPFAINWNGETRRNWLIPYNGSRQTAASLKAEKYAHGVGAPGHWKGDVWVYDFPDLGLNDTRQHVPMPVRALYSNLDGSPLEVLASEIFTPLVYRNDMPSPFNRK